MFSSFVSRAKSVLTAKGGQTADGGPYIFPTVDPALDGENCKHDCTNCTAQYPSRFKVETQRQLYGNVKPFTTHVLVATGKSDWQPKVENIQGSLMEALAKSSSPFSEQNRLMISASNLPILHAEGKADISSDEETTVLLLPAFEFVDRVRARDIPELRNQFINPVSEKNGVIKSEHIAEANAGGRLMGRPCERDYIVLLCSHKSRDARCGISAPIIKRELERHLRPAGLLRDESDERPGGVGIYFVSHVGGHKFSANVLIYRREAEQLIWLARVRPEHCEGIVNFTILKGKVVHPDFQLRGGFDHKRSLTSW